MHGLFSDIPEEQLQRFELSRKIPYKLRKLILSGRIIYSWPAYAKAFGFITMEKIISVEGVAKYVTKYITKQLNDTSISVNDHLYYCSHGLKRAERLFEGALTKPFEPGFENDYVAIKTLRTWDEATSYFCDDDEPVSAVLK